MFGKRFFVVGVVVSVVGVGFINLSLKEMFRFVVFVLERVFGVIWLYVEFFRFFY